MKGLCQNLNICIWLKSWQISVNKTIILPIQQIYPTSSVSTGKYLFKSASYIYIPAELINYNTKVTLCAFPATKFNWPLAPSTVKTLSSVVLLFLSPVLHLFNYFCFPPSFLYSVNVIKFKEENADFLSSKLTNSLSHCRNIQMEPWSSPSVVVEVRTLCRTVQTSHLTALVLDLQKSQYLFKTCV